MNEEIKEIMKSITVDRIVGTQEYCCIEKEKVRTLLDYITNLQQRVEQLEKENKELREFEFLHTQTTLDIINERDEHFVKVIKLEKKVIELENIRKEVIEYIENDLKKKNYFEFDENGAKYLLNILNKGSN